ncbi:N,N-dimethylformamidase beta subunit family domain-containing protein, partial [Pontibacter saemangeumensis]|uniref:N,N-dimethylformamidase beta subunit family domain-containing protein n=1 Tax=Pontibacter saemangeumensis TaxID=1084525 RepID=UPI0031F09ABF
MKNVFNIKCLHVAGDSSLREVFSESYCVSEGKSSFLLWHPCLKIAIIVFLLFGFSLSSTTAQNAIVTENARPGSPVSEWQISGAGDLSIQGFATDISYNKGETARFKIKTSARAYTIRIYRLGFYQGNGARFQGAATVTAALPQSQPVCLTNSGTGLIDCGNWSESGSWAIPSTAVSGIYIAKLTRTDTGGASHIVFIVRDDAGTSDLLFQTSDATWQAYNIYGDNNNGKSLYTGAGGKAVKVSYNRPFLTRSGGGGGGPEEDWLFNAEYPMIRWIESNGYDVSYTTNVDSDRRGSLIKNHKVFLSVGHDEYWSGAHRANVTAARNAGTHLAFFSGNEVYWKTRWENSIDANGTPFRTLVCYKEGSTGENTCSGKCDPSPEWTGLWRSGCEYATGDPLVDGCNPENALTGQISWEDATSALQVPYTYKNFRFWRNTSVASLGNGQTATFTQGTIGYEWNSEQELYRSSYPYGRMILSRTVVNGEVHNISLYRHSSGALVFGAGTVQWSWGLDSNHDRGSAAPSAAMQQATLNLFADMGAQPGTIQSGLVAATASTDTQAPATFISSPSEGANLSAGSNVTINGTASDANVVAGVEISTDGGNTWRLANGTTNWTINWTPTAQGLATIKSRAFDDSGNLSSPITVNVSISGTSSATCPCTVFQTSDTPSGSLQNDGQGLQLGMKFRTTVGGFITGIRFFKQIGNTGTHIGQLYNSTGTLLAQATFTNETASGWQQVDFSSPVSVTENTTYIISYHSSAGYYSSNDNGFSQAVANGPLIGLQNGTDGPNGVYRYTNSPAFPNNNFAASNYWVDVVFNTRATPVNQAPSVSISSPANNSTFTAPATIAIAATASDA